MIVLMFAQPNGLVTDARHTACHATLSFRLATVAATAHPIRGRLEGGLLAIFVAVEQQICAALVIRHIFQLRIAEIDTGRINN